MNILLILEIITLCLILIWYYCILYYISLVWEDSDRRVKLRDRMSRP